MLNFVLSSKKYIKEWNSFLYPSFLDADPAGEEYEFSTFSFLILKNYFSFLIFKIKVILNISSQTTFLHREKAVVDKLFKHLLIVEWGRYGDENANLSDFGWLGPSDGSFARPQGIMEASISSIDLAKPIHKLFYGRYIHRDVYKPNLPVLPRTFFFNFYLYMPITQVFPGDLRVIKSRIGESSKNDYKTPYEIEFPILFEFFLLKFTFFSVIFSSSNSNIYEFYSAALLESIFIRFRNILDKILISLFKSFWPAPLKNSSSFKKINLYLIFTGNVTFYSKKFVNTHRMSFSGFKIYSTLKFENLKFLNLNLNFWFSLILLCEFIFIFIYVDYSGLDLNFLTFFLHYRSIIRLKFFSFIFLLFLFFCFFYFSLLFFIRVLAYLYGFSPVYVKYYFLKLYLQKGFREFFLAWFEKIFSNLFFFLLFIFLLYNFTYFSNNAFYVSFMITLLTYYSFRFVNALVNFLLNFILIIFRFKILKRKIIKSDIFLDKIANNAYLLIFLPFSLIFYIVLSFICFSVLQFCYFLRVFYPPIDQKYLDRITYFETENYVNSAFRLPFVDSEMDILAIFTRGLDFGPPICPASAPRDLVLNSLIKPWTPERWDLSKYLKIYQSSPNYHLGVFNKFLINRAGRLFEIEYFGFDFLNNKYKTRKVNHFPNKFFYFFLIFFSYFWFFFITLPVIITVYYFRLRVFFSYLAFGSFSKRSVSLFKNLKSDTDPVFFSELIKEHLYYAYWLESQIYFSSSTNSYNKAICSHLFSNII